MPQPQRPWEKYQQGSAPAEGPWTQYQQPAPAPKKSTVGFKPEMAAPLEVGAQLVTGAIAEPVAGLAGLLAAITPGGEPAGNVVRNTREAMTYQPRTEFARNMIPNAVQGVVDMTPEFIRKPVGRGVESYSQLEKWTADNYGPAAAAAVATLPTAILEAIPAGLALRKVRRAGEPAPSQYAGPVRQPEPEVMPPEQYQRMGSDFRSANPQRIAPAVAPDLKIMEDAKELGIDLNPSHYSTNRAYIDMEQALKSRPGSLLQSVEERAIINLGNRADELIERLGGSFDKSALDETLRNDFTSTITGLNRQSDSLYDKVNSAIPRATRVTPQTTRAFIDSQIEELGGNEALLTTAERSLQRLFKKAKDGAEGEFENPTYAALDRVRKDIGSAIGSRSGPFKDDDTGQLRRLYAVLAEDQQKFAEAFGVGDVYQDAQALVRQRKRLEEQAVSLFGRDIQGSIIPKLRQSANGLSQGDVSKLTTMMDSVPESMRQDVAATLLNDIFASGARRNAPIGQGFVNAFNGLNRNSGAKNALFQYLPKEAEERFNRIGRVATGIYRAKALENNSKTARDVIAALDDGGLLRRMYGIGTRIAAAEGVSTVIGVPGAGTAGVLGSVLSRGATKATQTADELLSSRGFEQAVKDYATGAGARAQARLQNTPEYNAWLDAQNPSVKAEIVAIGLIPWLTTEREKANVPRDK